MNTIEKFKDSGFKQINAIEKDIIQLQSNIQKAKAIIDSVNTNEDLENLEDYDIEEGLRVIELFF